MGRGGEGPDFKAAYLDGLRLTPGFTVAQAEKWLAMRDREFKAAYLDGLRKAGLPA